MLYICIPVISITPGRSTTRNTSLNDAFRTCSMITYLGSSCVNGYKQQQNSVFFLQKWQIKEPGVCDEMCCLHDNENI